MCCSTAWRGGHLALMQYHISKGAPVAPDNQGMSVLMEAVHHGHVGMVQYLVENQGSLGCDVNDVDHAGRNVLFYCCEGNHVGLLEYLVNKGAEIKPASDGRTLLMVATLKNNTTMVKHLLGNAMRFGLDVNERDSKGRNAMFYCITGGDLKLFHLLRELGVRVEASGDGITPLMQAVAKGQVEFTQHLLENAAKYAIDIKQMDKDGWNVLFYAVAGGQLPLFKTLYAMGTPIETAKDGRTILMQAVARGDMDMVRYLLDNCYKFSLDVNQRDNDGWNSLFYCVQKEHVEVFMFLVKRGARIQRSNTGATVLIEAADKGCTDLVHYLLRTADDLGLDLNDKDNDGSNALFYCIAGGYIDLLKTFIKHGISVTSDSYGRTILMQAALSGHIDIAQYLILNDSRLKLDIYQQDNDGRNVLFYSIEGGNLAMLDFLFGCGIPCVSDKNGKTNLMQAALGGHVTIVEYLLDHLSELELDVRSRDQAGENALDYAWRGKHKQILNTLLEKGSDISVSAQGESLFLQCLDEGEEGVLETIINNSVDLTRAVNAKDEKGRSFLFSCIHKGDYNSLARFGKFYCSDDDGDNEGTTLLMKACITPNLKFVEYLVETVMVNVHAQDKQQKNALFYALESSNLEAIKYLLSHGAKLDDDARGRSLLMAAADTGNLKIAEYLLQNDFQKTRVNSCDNVGKTVAHYCAIKGHESLLKIVTSHGAILEAEDKYGIRPLMYACANGQINIVNFLANQGVKVGALDTDGRHALHHCFLTDSPHRLCVKRLIREEIDVNAPDNKHIRAVMLACRVCPRSHLDVIELLLEHGADPVLQDNETNDAFDYASRPDTRHLLEKYTGQSLRMRP